MHTYHAYKYEVLQATFVQLTRLNSHLPVKLNLIQSNWVPNKNLSKKRFHKSNSNINYQQA